MSFSALQRAENSSPNRACPPYRHPVSFSALQRAENSSWVAAGRLDDARSGVSVLFSEPKIPQRDFSRWRWRGTSPVSVLFSEPKIPHTAPSCCALPLLGVSVLFSEPKIPHRACTDRAILPPGFQCSSASRKFLSWCSGTLEYCSGVSVLFSEPKIPQMWQRGGLFAPLPFQCSSASRKFLNR